jgi:hypothetical protein
MAAASKIPAKFGPSSFLGAMVHVCFLKPVFGCYLHCCLVKEYLFCQKKVESNDYGI